METEKGRQNYQLSVKCSGGSNASLKLGGGGGGGGAAPLALWSPCVDIMVTQHLPSQGCSQGEGVQGVQLKPPLQINDIHDYCYALEKLRAEIYCIIYIYFFMLIQHILIRIS